MSKRTLNLVAGCILLFITMAVTRASHVGSAVSLPDASYGVILLLGYLLADTRRSTRLTMLTLTILFAMGIDFIVTTVGGVSSYCITPAYTGHIASMVVLFAGGYAIRMHRPFKSELISVISGSMIFGTTAYLTSEYTFYFLSGKMATTNLVEYANASMENAPVYVGIGMFYTIILVATLRIMKAVILNDKEGLTTKG